MKSEVISFRVDIQPSQTGTLIERIKDTGAVTEIRLRFYPGQERSLQVRPYIQLFNSMSEDVVTWGAGTTEKFFSGDDDYFVFPVSADVVADDNIAVWYNNTDTVNVYTLVCDVVITYYG